MRNLKAALCFGLLVVTAAVGSQKAFAGRNDQAIQEASRRLTEIERILNKSRNANQLWNARAAIQNVVGDVKEILLQANTGGGGSQVFDGYGEGGLDTEWKARKDAEENALAACINAGYEDCKLMSNATGDYIGRNGRIVYVAHARVIGR